MTDYLATLQRDQMWAGWFRYTSATFRAKMVSFYSALISKTRVTRKGIARVFVGRAQKLNVH